MNGYSITDHFFFFLGFLILRLARGMGILKPSSAGSVIFTIFLTICIPFAISLTSLSFYSEMLGVKFIISILMLLKDLI